jgi:acyl-CoA thioester hydrolase
MALADFRHCVPLRVRWAEVDKQGVVFNGHYLLYADVCITEYWRAIGFAYPEGFEPLGGDVYVRKATVDFRAAALYDDELAVCGRIAQIGRSSLRFMVEMYRQGDTQEPLALVELVYVYVDAKSKEPKRVDDAIRAKIRAFEVLAPDEQASGAR